MWSIFVLAVSSTLALGATLPRAAGPPGDALLQTVYEFPVGTWVENIAMRENGLVLVGLIDKPEVWQINPRNQDAELLFDFPDAASVMGISEVEEDEFVVAVGNFSYVTGLATPGSWSVWEIKFGDGHHRSNHRHDWQPQEGPVVRKITDIPEAAFLNGNTALRTEPGVALIGDCGNGVIYRLDASNGDYAIIADDPAFKPNASVPIQIGVNGIRYRDGYVYFVNTFQPPLYARFPVDSSGQQAGPVKVIAESATFPLRSGAAGDDFTLDRKGNAWLTTASNTLVKITPEGEQFVIAGGVNSTTLEGCTSAAFGRTRSTRDILYITTNGGVGQPELGVEGGKLVMLDVGSL